MPNFQPSTSPTGTSCLLPSTILSDCCLHVGSPSGSGRSACTSDAMLIQNVWLLGSAETARSVQHFVAPRREEKVTGSGELVTAARIKPARVATLGASQSKAI